MDAEDRTHAKGRIARHLDAVREIRREPRAAARMVRAALLRLWRARGGGFYGLGYVVAFIVLEVRFVTSEFLGSEGIAQFVAHELLEYLFRFGWMTFLNGLLALIWPAFVLAWLGAWGIAVLVVGYFAFEHAARPLIEKWVPEIKDHREARERARTR